MFNLNDETVFSVNAEFQCEYALPWKAARKKLRSMPTRRRHVPLLTAVPMRAYSSGLLLRMAVISWLVPNVALAVITGRRIPAIGGSCGFVPYQRTQRPVVKLECVWRDDEIAGQEF
jgi:hypothetical protein